MKTLNASQSSYAGCSASRFDAAWVLAFSIAQSVNLRDAQRNEICRSGGVSCVPLNVWTSKLT